MRLSKRQSGLGLQIELTAEADADLKSIAKSGAIEFGIRAARRYQAELNRTMDTLARFPSAGRSADEILPGHRIHPVRSHQIIYRIRENSALVIVRVLHARQLPPDVL